MKRYKRVIFSGVRIPTWAMSYLVNADASGLDAEDKKTVDEWVERTRNGGRIDVNPLSDVEPYFTWHPAFGLACNVEDCDVIVDMSPRYPMNPCMRFGQSRFGPMKRTALDGRVWWCMYDFKEHKDVMGYKSRKRRQVLVQLVMDLLRDRLPYEPDPGFSRNWLKSKSGEEVADLVDRTTAF